MIEQTIELPSRLLVVDDDVAHLRALEEILQDLGHEVTVCASPYIAMEHLKQQKYDVLLSDLRMPEMDGIELMRAAMEIDPDLVSVLMTGYSSLDSAVQAMKAGALDYILKPFRIGALQPVLNRAIQVRRLRVDNRRLSTQLELRAEQLEAANAELDKFAARVAHDLRAPLNIIVGFADALTRSAANRLDPREQGHLERIVAAGQRASRLVSSLLSFARLGDGPLLRERVNLQQIVGCALACLANPADDRSSAIDWRISDLPEVEGDPILLGQVFANLLSNAVKYTREVDAPRVDIYFESMGEALNIVITDNGVGFDSFRKNDLFNPFVRLHDARRFEGIGMGLANVRRIVERHGGKVSATGKPGAGASFVLSFPVPKGA